MAKGYSGRFHKNKKTIRQNNLVANNGIHKCEYCSCEMQTLNELSDNFATIDHYIPLSKGGTHALSNLRLVCRKCNAIKANSVPDIRLFTLLNALDVFKREQQKAGRNSAVC